MSKQYRFLQEVLNISDWRIILASQSPRRIALLQNLGLDFVVMPADIHEYPAHYDSPQDFVRQNALAKAQKIAASSSFDLIIAADTEVEINGEILGKPENFEAAQEMLQKLSGKTHSVCTAICLKMPSQEIVDSETTEVTFATLTDREIAAYIKSGEPFDKAGGYGIQGLATPFITRINGDFYNVMGFPVALFYQHFKHLAGLTKVD
jgi:septum formation protein